MSLFEPKHYKLRGEVVATELDDHDRPRFPRDTHLPLGTEFVLLEEKHHWPTPDDSLHYTIELRSPGRPLKIGARYSVPADELEKLMESAE